MKWTLVLCAKKSGIIKMFVITGMEAGWILHQVRRAHHVILAIFFINSQKTEHSDVVLNEAIDIFAGFWLSLGNLETSHWNEKCIPQNTTLPFPVFFFNTFFFVSWILAYYIVFTIILQLSITWIFIINYLLGI